jgi:hypothetical protein
LKCRPPQSLKEGRRNLFGLFGGLSRYIAPALDFFDAFLSGTADPSTPEVPTACFVPVVAKAAGFSMIDWKATKAFSPTPSSNAIFIKKDLGSGLGVVGCTESRSPRVR